jgi:hypothetical protein
MPTAPEPFPWWLWLLAALWAGTLVLWQRRVLPRDWSLALGLVVLVYTGLLTWSVIEPAGWTIARGAFWACAAAALAGGLSLVHHASPEAERIGLGVFCLGVAGMLASFGATALAGLTLLGGLLVACRSLVRVLSSRGERSIESVSEQAPPFSVPNRDAWLIGVMAVLVLVGWTGSVRYALTVESQRPGPSHWFTALPSRDRLTTWLVTEPGHNPSASPRSAPAGVPWELIGLSAIWVWMVSRRTAP